MRKRVEVLDRLGRLLFFIFLRSEATPWIVPTAQAKTQTKTRFCPVTGFGVAPNKQASCRKNAVICRQDALLAKNEKL